MAEQEEFNLDGGTENEPGSDPVVVEDESGSEPTDPVVEPEPKPDPMESQLAEERERRIRLEERLAVQQETPPPAAEPPPKEFTRAELRTAREDGKIDEDQLEEIWSTQQRSAIRRDTEELLDKRDRDRTAINVVETETQKYHEAYPDITDVKSDAWAKVKSEYDFLVKIGNPDSKATELMALRSALGNPTRVRERTSQLRETPKETSSGVGDPGGRGERPVDIFNQIPLKYRAYTKDRYDTGQITLEDIKKDLPYMKKLAS
jgi:hypothetical protein